MHNGSRPELSFWIGDSTLESRVGGVSASDMRCAISARNHHLRRRRVNPYPRNKALAKHELETSGGVGPPVGVGPARRAPARQGFGVIFNPLARRALRAGVVKNIAGQAPFDDKLQYRIVLLRWKIGTMEQVLDGTLAAAASGDESAWRRIIDAYSGRVYGLLVRQCRDRELAEEITQATFVKIVHKLGEYNESGKFESWLFRIAMNRLRDEMRRRKRQANPVDFAGTPPESIGYADAAEDAGPAQPLIDAEQNEALHAAIAELPEADQELLHLRYTAGLGYQEIADALDQPLGTVLARGHRALKKLKAKLTETDVNAA